MCEKFKVIDLFAGCGGFSKGFQMTNHFDIKLAIEIDENASKTYKENHKDTVLISEDITKITVENISEIANNIDVVIGGPPCQGFSLAGKRDPKDPRNSLFREFVRIIKFIQPKVFVMENVIGILSAKTENKEKVIDIILNEFNKANYYTFVQKLKASDFGVPQDRVRVFITGFRKDLPYYFSEYLPQTNKYITVEEAIMDLPLIYAGEIGTGLPYSSPPQNPYQVLMRENAPDIVTCHDAMKHTKRLIERFQHIKQGQSLKDVAEEFGAVKRGNPKEKSGIIYGQNNYRMIANKQSPTITASFQSNFIHPFMDRNLTAREAARLQSFPDDFLFLGPRTKMSWENGLSQYQQIGNAVSPLLAKHIAMSIYYYFLFLNGEITKEEFLQKNLVLNLNQKNDYLS